MQSSEFVKKFSSWYLWKNILIMGLVVAVLGVGVKFGLDFYTHHGEAIPVPDLKHKSLTDAEHLVHELGLEIQVVDTGWTIAGSGRESEVGTHYLCHHQLASVPNHHTARHHRQQFIARGDGKINRHGL